MLAVAAVAAPTVCRADATDDYNLSLQMYKQERWQQAVDLLTGFLKAAPEHEKAANAKLYLGQSLVHLRKFDEARPVFREFVRSHPEHRDASLGKYRVAECSYFLDDSPTARKEFRDFLDTAPADHALLKWALLYLGETELRLKNMQDAADAFEQLLTQFGDSPLADDARFGLARAYESLDRRAEAIGLYRQLAENEQGLRAADAQFNLSARLFEDQQFADAAASFDAVVKKFPDSSLAPLAQLNAGFSRYHQGDHAAAIESFERVRDDAKYGSTARYWIGLSQKSLGEFDKASETLLSAYRENEDQPLAANMLFYAAESKLGAKAYDESMQLFLTVFEKWPDSEQADDALHSAVEAALLAGKVTEAEQVRRQFVEQFPNSGLQLSVELLHGRVLLARGDELADEGTDESRGKSKQAYELAAATFQNVLDNSTIPQTLSMARLQLARAFDRLGEYDRLVETLEPLATAATTDGAGDEELRALVMQSNGWLSLKKFDRSLETAKQYLARRPKGEDVGEALANITVSLANLKEWEGAEASLAQLREVNDQKLTDRITYEVAELEYEASRFESAARLFDTIFQQGAEGEFYVPSVSGAAYCLHYEGVAALDAAKGLKEGGEQIDGTARLADALGKFEEAATWFGRLRELAAAKSDPLVESNAAYMQGLSLRLAKRGEQAMEVFLPAIKQFSLAAEDTNPSEQQLNAAMNAYRIAKEAARTVTEMSQVDRESNQVEQANEHVDQADKAYSAAYDALKRQPVERQQGLDLLINEWALLHYGVKEFDRAAELFKLLVEVQPQSEWADDARYLIAENDFFADKWEPARDALLTLVKEPDTDDFVREKALILIVDSAAFLDDWATVKTAAETLRDSFPNGENRWYAEYRIGESALRTGDNQTAATVLSALLEQRATPEFAEAEWLPSAWLLMAEAQLALKSNQYADVEQTVAQFKQENSDSPFTYQFDDVLGRRFKNEARFEEAREAFQRVIDSSEGKGTETAAKAQFFIGETWLTQANAFKDDVEQAKPAYENAFVAYYKVSLYAFPEWRAPALLLAGKCDEALKRPDEAKKSYQQLIDDHPDTEYAAEARGRLEDLQKRFPEAKTP